MNILVTGGAGFIGSHLCDALYEAGHNVHVLDNLSLGVERNIAHLLGLPRFSFVHGDILNAGVLNTLFKNAEIDCVFHMAANSDIAKSHISPSIDLENTFLTTYNLLEAMRANRVSKIVFASTSAIYGEAKGRVGESYGPIEPISHYGAAKMASEAFISSYGENYGIQSWITRFPNVVGPRGTHGAIYDFVHKLRKTPEVLTVLGDGTQEKPYLNVNDLVSAILFIWTNTNRRFNAYNVGADTKTTVKRIAEIVIEEGPGTPSINYTGGNRGWVGDVPKFEYDTSELKKLGWSPKYTSDEAVRIAARAIWDETQ